MFMCHSGKTDHDSGAHAVFHLNLPRRLPALRCQSVCLQWQKPEPSDHSSLNFNFGSRSFWTLKITYVWWIYVWISFPSTKLAASCYPPSPEPRQKRTLSTLQRKYLNIELTPELTRTHSAAQVKPSGFLHFAHLDPDSLYPWRPDCTHLLTIHPFMFQTHLL
ncbi:hypothetical protein ATANTOWER_015441 [Ataeniobius toweri]|uniref:Uncharacterized protein n=1 Tax=Ataeniobius toweri TaxID=208326 RepID=A0ABU7AQX3_9TELE|nr:hypothetical protein [Ataeniobius toweri]